MFQGQLLAIAICPAKAQPMQGVSSARAIVGRGLEGDRYALAAGTGQKGPARPDQEVTLIEAEAIAALETDYKLPIDHLTTRRNLLTQGVPLNHLVGREFSVGPVLLRGIELCEPCGHLERLTCDGIKKALLHRGGLRAQVLRSGELQIGAAIVPAARIA